MPVLYEYSVQHEPLLEYLGEPGSVASRARRVEDLGQALNPSWLSELFVEWTADEPEPELRTESLLYDLRARAEELRYLRAVARLTSFMGVLGALAHMLGWWVESGFQSPGGPVAFDPVAEIDMMQEALLCITIGTVASSVIIFGMYVGYRRARELVSSCVRVRRRLGGLLREDEKDA